MAEAGYDPARLPPGQYLTEKWPVLHAGSVPYVDLATWTLTVSGEVERPLTLTWNELLELPSREITVDIHCVTRWSRFDTTFKGVHWSELAKLVSPSPAARFVVAHAEQGFTSNMPLEAIEDERRADRLRGRRRAAHPRPRLAGPAGRSLALLLEERQVADAGSSCSTTTSPASGSATATTTTPTSRRSSVIRSKVRPAAGRYREGSTSPTSTKGPPCAALSRSPRAA